MMFQTISGDGCGHTPDDHPHLSGCTCWSLGPSGPLLAYSVIASSRSKAPKAADRILEPKTLCRLLSLHGKLLQYALDRDSVFS
jgi:hypothetical protein